MNINEINKFPMGTHKQQCIGPCFPENTVLINPLTLVMGEADKPSCSVLPWNNNGKIEHFDNCDNPIDKKDVEQISLNYVVPIVHFNCEYFLKTYYDIFSFDETIDWIANNNDPVNTKLRVMECSWKLYGLKIDIIDEQIIQFYSHVFKKVWINKFYQKLYKYIYVDGKNIYFKKNNDKINDNKIERMNFLNEQFNTSDIIYSVLTSYLDINKKNWDKIQNHNEAIKKYYIKYIEEKINELLK